MALEGSRMVLCSPDRGAHGGYEYWRTLLYKLTLTTIQLPDDAIYVPLGRKTPIGKLGWGSMLSEVDKRLAPVPWEDLDPEIYRESDRYTLSVLNDRLRPPLCKPSLVTKRTCLLAAQLDNHRLWSYTLAGASTAFDGASERCRIPLQRLPSTAVGTLVCNASATGSLPRPLILSRPVCI